MTRKDYELLAYAVKLSSPGGKREDRTWNILDEQWADTAHCIADALQGDNPRFDRDRFLRACGVGESNGATPKPTRISLEVSERERDNIAVALNYWLVNRASGDWGATMSEMHMKADGRQPLTRKQIDSLIGRLECDGRPGS